MKKIILFVALFVLPVIYAVNEPDVMNHWSEYNLLNDPATVVTYGGTWNEPGRLYDNFSYYSPANPTNDYGYTSTARAYIIFNFTSNKYIEGFGMGMYKSTWCYSDAVYNITCADADDNDFSETIYYQDYYGVEAHPFNISGGNLSLSCKSVKLTFETRCGETSGDCGESCIYYEMALMEGSAPVIPEAEPVINVTYPELNSVVYDPDIYLNLSVNVTSNCSLNNTYWSLYGNYSWLASNVPDGLYNILVVCNNSNDNTKYSEVIHNFTVATRRINITNPENNTVWRTNPFNVSFELFNFNASNCTLYDNSTNRSILYNANTSMNYNLSYPYGDNLVFDIEYYVMCANVSLYINSSIYFMHYDTDFYPPNITIIFPPSGYENNTEVDINFSTHEPAVCTVNSSYYSYNSSYSNTTSHYWNDNALPNGEHYIQINCTDPSNNSATANISFYKDITFPDITQIFPAPDNSTRTDNIGAFIFATNLTDDSMLWSFEVNITDYSGLTPRILYRYNETITGLSHVYAQNVQTYNFTNDTELIYWVRLCDGHTANNILPAKEIIKGTDHLIFEFDDGTIINVSSTGGDEVQADTTFLEDRYTFEFYYSKKSKHKFTLASNHDIHYIGDSKYPGHFIINDHWVDFNYPGAERNDVKVKYKTDHWEIEIKPDDEYILFNSVGELNCLSEEYSFVLLAIVPPFYELDMNNLSSMALLFILIVLWLGILVTGLYFDNFILESLAVFIGIILGIYLVNVHKFLMISTIIINIVFFFGILSKK